MSTTEAGAYAVASQLAAIITLPLAAMLQSVSPRLSALSATGDIEGLRRLTQRTAQLTVVIALPILLVLLVGGRWILTLYGSSYRAAYPVLAILALSQLLGGMGGLGGFLLNMTGQQRKAAPVIMLSAAVNLMFTFLLIPRYGSVGAASATCIGLTLRTILVIAVSRRVTGVLPVPWRVSK